MRVGDGRSDVEVDDGGRVVDVEVGREVEEVGRDVDEELLEVSDELELSDVLLELSELEELEDEDVEEERSEVEEELLEEVLELEVRVEVGSLVRVRVEVLEVIGAGASERCFVCFLYLTLPGGGSFFTGSPLSASVM